VSLWIVAIYGVLEPRNLARPQHHRPAVVYFQSHILGGGNVPGYGPRLIAAENAAIAFPAGRSRTNIFSAGPREAPKPGAAGGSRLAPPRSCAAASSPVPALDPAGDGRPLGYHVDWVDYVVTGAEARRVRVAVLPRATTRGHPVGTAVQHWPSFFASDPPGGNGATRAARRETARPSRRLSCGRKANSRGMLFEISDGDDQLQL
jgi:hypothetical protein